MYSIPKTITWFSQGAIGDTLMTLSLFDAMHKVNKSFSFEIIATRNVAAIKELAGFFPAVRVINCAELYRIKTLRYFATVFFSPRIAVVPPTFGVHPFLVKLMVGFLTLRPGNITFGFTDKGRWQPYKEVLVFNIVKLFYENLLMIPEVLGICIQSRIPYLKLKPESASFQFHELASKKYIVVHPFAANPKRSLPPGRWIDLLRHLVSTYHDVEVVVTAAKSDAVSAHVLVSSVPEIVSVVGVSLEDLAVLIDKACVYIGVDTGITHLAGVLQKKSVIIGNLSNPCWLPYYNNNARILFEKARCACRGDKSGGCNERINGQDYYRCMIDIPQSKIEKEIQELLQSKV